MFYLHPFGGNNGDKADLTAPQGLQRIEQSTAMTCMYGGVDARYERPCGQGNVNFVCRI